MNEFVITINEEKNKISMLNGTEANLNGEIVNYELQILGNNTYLIRINNSIYEVSVKQVNNEKFSFLVNGNKIDLVARSELEERANKIMEAAKSSLSSTVEVNAPMPGMILKINKNNGEEINQGESVLILEAMKMENDLKSPSTGKIKKLFVSEGNAVEKGDLLFSIE
jgi:biotin carboxyl carrier protein